MSLDLQNMCSWMEKNSKQMLWLQTRVEILNLSQKKCASRVEKKKELESRMRSECWPVVLSVNVFTKLRWDFDLK